MRTAISDRLAGALGTAAVLSLIGMVLLAGLGVEMPHPILPTPTVVTIDARPPPRPPRRPVAPVRSPRRSGRAAPPNLKNKATPVVAPPPLLVPPVPTIVVAAKPDLGMAGNSGAAPHVGPGEGAGGLGDGRGSGGAGDGDGGGDTPPRQIGGKLDFADVPRALRDAGVGGTVRVRYRVETDGRVDDCAIDLSSGNAELDGVTCALIERRFHFVPAHDAAGRPFRSTVVERHSWINRIGAPPRGFADDR